MVREAERALGVRLPLALLDLLRIQNGGIVAAQHDAFPTRQPTSWNEDHVPFESLMGIGRCDRVTSLLDTPYLVEEWGMPAPLVLLSGDEHCWIALDYRTCGRDGDPSVTWFETDLATELVLAGDFCSFVEGLTAGSTYGDGGPAPGVGKRRCWLRLVWWWGCWPGVVGTGCSPSLGPAELIPAAAGCARFTMRVRI